MGTFNQRDARGRPGCFGLISSVESRGSAALDETGVVRRQLPAGLSVDQSVFQVNQLSLYGLSGLSRGLTVRMVLFSGGFSKLEDFPVITRDFSVSYGTKAIAPANPTAETCQALDRVYQKFNVKLFGGELRNPLITVQRLRGRYGCFAGARYLCRDDERQADAIILDARHWGPQRSTMEQLSTVAHEMVHLWQYHHGKGSRGPYHNRQFSRRMLEIGLVTSSTGAPGGKPTGSKISHYILPGGAFEGLCTTLLNDGFVLPYYERQRGNDGGLRRRMIAKAQSKSAYTCPDCDPPVNVWGKPGLRILCGVCSNEFCCAATDRGPETD
jgi:hypothetical protein